MLDGHVLKSSLSGPLCPPHDDIRFGVHSTPRGAHGGQGSKDTPRTSLADSILFANGGGGNQPFICKGFRYYDLVMIKTKSLNG